MLAARPRRKSGKPIDLKLCNDTAIAEIMTLREMEALNRERSTLMQWRMNGMAGLYGRTIFVGPNMDRGRWTHLAQAKDIDGNNCWVVRHGKKGVLPPRKLLEHHGARDFTVAPDVADGLLARDGGWTAPGKPI